MPSSRKKNKYKSIAMAINFSSTRRKVNMEELLCQDLIENILTRIPSKPRTRFKSVSKSWFNIITNLRPTISSCLIISTQSGSTILEVKDQGQRCIEQRFDMKDIKLIVSCNGLLLYHQAHLSGPLQFYVSCPALNQSDLALPRIYGKVYGHYRVGVFFNEPQLFKVICFSISEEWSLYRQTQTQAIDCQILSSDTWTWRSYPVRIFNAPLLYRVDTYFHHYPHCVHHEGRLYWLHSQCSLPLMLLYHIEKHFFKVVLLPNRGRVSEPDRLDLLYESEGRLCYCELNRDGLIMWTYRDDADADDDIDSDTDVDKCVAAELKWRMMLSITRDELIQKFSEAFPGSCQRYVSWRRPVAFSDELQILYIWASEMIWAYSLESQRIIKVWSAPVGEMTWGLSIQPFVSNPVNLV